MWRNKRVNNWGTMRLSEHLTGLAEKTVEQTTEIWNLGLRHRAYGH